MTYSIKILRNRQGFYRLLLAFSQGQLLFTRTDGPYRSRRLASGK